MPNSIHLIRFLSVVVALIALTCLGCSEVAPTNPFDPETPVAQQAKANVTGDVLLPEGEADPSVFEMGQVGLFLQEKTAPSRIRACLSEDLAWITNEALVTDGLISNGNNAAVFSMSGVPGGVYDLVLCVQGYAPLVIPGLFVERGVDKALSLRLIAPTVEVSDTFMAGRVTLEGAPQNGHGRVLVSTVGRPYSATTAENGEFIMPLPPGTYDISVSREGFAREVRSDLIVAPNETLTVGDIFLAKDTSGRVRGQLSTTITSYEWARTTEVRLIGDGIARTAIPSATGVFEFEQLAPGLYGLEIISQGHLNTSRVIEVVSGELDLEMIALEPESTSESAVYLRGKVYLQDQDRDGPFHRGILVHVLRDNQLVASTLTDIDGEFALVASRLNYTLRFEKPGYESRNEAVSWVEGNNRFELNGVALSEERIGLQRIPINGVLSVPVVVRPNWIPVEQRYVSLAITQLDGDFSRVIESVVDGEVVVLSELPAGTFQVSLSRPGFTTVTTPPIVLSTLNQSSMVSPLVARLTRLADTNLDLDNQTLNACELRAVRVNYQGGDFSGATFTGNLGPENEDSNCEYCANGNPEGNECGALDFTGANFINALFEESGVRLSGATFTRANLFGARLDNVDASEADFRFANLFGVSAQGAQFAGANFFHANLTSASLQGASFAYSAGVHQADMDLTNSVVRIAEPVPHPWAGLAKPVAPLPTDPCNVGESTTNLVRTNFAQANLSNAVMFGVDLSEAILADALIIGGDLRHVCLANSSLNLTDLSNAVLDGADFSGARLINSILYRIKARGTNFTDANLTSAVIELAEFMPIGAMEDDGIVDDMCARPLSWSDYYPSENEQSQTNSNCNDGIDNDEDGFIDANDPSCQMPNSQSEFAPVCFSDDTPTAACGCRTRFEGANFNGANLIGTRFDGADLTRATMLGAIMGRSQEFPVRPSDACNQAQVEHCVDFCFDGGTRLFANNEVCEVSSEQDYTDSICLGSWSAGCRAKTSELDIPMETISCLHGQHLERDALCPDYGDADLGIYRGCIIGFQFGPIQNLPVDIKESLPPSYAPPAAKCSQKMIQQTWALNRNGLKCSEQVSLTDDPSRWDCCPEVYIDEDCTAAVTSFLGARLSQTEFTAGDLSGAELVEANLSEADLSGASLINASLKSADLRNLVARSSRFTNANLRLSNLTGATISQSVLTRTDLSGSNLSGASFAGSTLLYPKIDNVFVVENSAPIDFTNSTLKFSAFNPSKNTVLMGGFRDATIENFKSAAGRVVNSEFAQNTLSGFELYIGLGVGEILGPQLLNTTFDVVEAAGLKISGGDGVLGKIGNVRFDQLTINAEAQRHTGMSSLRSLAVSDLRILNSDLTGFGFQDLTVSDLVLYSVDWAESEWRDLSINSAIMIDVEGDIAGRGNLNIHQSSMTNVTAFANLGGATIGISNSRLKGVELSAGDSGGAITGTLSGLEINSLFVNGPVNELQANNLDLTYRRPRSIDGRTSCTDFELGAVCREGERCYGGECYRACVTDTDCPGDSFCDLMMCRPIEDRVAGSMTLKGDVIGSVFNDVKGDSLEIDGGRLDASFSSLSLRALSFTEIIRNAWDAVELSDSQLETLMIHQSALQSLTLSNVDVSTATYLDDSTFDSLEVLFRPANRAGAVCGSRLQIALGGSEQPLNLDYADLRGVCDLPANWDETSLNGTVMCQDDITRAFNYTGTPIGVFCQRVLCPKQPDCQ